MVNLVADGVELFGEEAMMAEGEYCTPTPEVRPLKARNALIRRGETHK